MEKFKISNEGIQQAVEYVSDFLAKHKVEQKDVLRLSLAMEDTLLNYRDALGEAAVCGLKCVNQFGRLRVELSIGGASLDVFKSSDDEDFSRMLMSGVGMAPVWQYKNGQNIVVFTPKKKKPSQLVYIVAAIVLALVCGGLSRMLPQNAQTFISEQFLTPIADTYLGLLNAVAGIMIFLSVVWGILSIGDMTTLTAVGKKLIGRMLLMLVVLPTVFILCMMPFLDYSKGAVSGAVDFAGPFGMILGIIPSNLISPFVDGNFLQIIFIAAIVGIAILMLGAKASTVTSFIEQANAVVQLILEVVCALISLVIFITVYNMVVSGSFSVLFDAYKAPLLILVGCLFAMAFYMCVICITKRVKPSVFLKKIMPSFLIGLTTASSSAAMSTVMETCDKKYGIDKKIINFGIPLGQIIFGMGSVIDFVALSFCMAEIYAVAVTPMWCVMAIFTSVILTVATPPIPGGGVAIITILFTQLGLPLDGLAVAVAIDVVADFFVTATNVFCRQGELILIAGKLDMIDTKVLKSKN